MGEELLARTSQPVFLLAPPVTPPNGAGDQVEDSKSTMPVSFLTLLGNCHHVAVLAAYSCIKGTEGLHF